VRYPTGPCCRVALQLLAASALLAACRPGVPDGPGAHALADAHAHLSYEDSSKLDSLVARGITAVRDCGGDLSVLSRWRAEIAAGTRRGPRLYIAGPVLDGPKPDARYRLTVRTAAEAERAVDSLAALGVDFIKTHNAIPPEAFFAVLRRARVHRLKVAAHLPRGVPAWVAADSGAGSIEHMAESVLASPIYAGIARDPEAAVRWWASPAGDSMIAHLARTGVTVTPTLVRYEATLGMAPTPEVREARARLLPELIKLTGRLHRAGVPLLTGSDLVGVPPGTAPRDGIAREVELLQAAGLRPAEARAASSAAALAEWFHPRPEKRE